MAVPAETRRLPLVDGARPIGITSQAVPQEADDSETGAMVERIST